MNNPSYHPGNLSGNNSPYHNLSNSGHPNISPHQLQQGQSGLPPHTLPPLQPNQQASATMQSLYGGGSAPHTPRTPATPNTPNGANSMNSFQMPGQPGRAYQQMMPNGYQQPPQQYRTTASMLPQATTAMSHPQPIAPAPTQSRMPQNLQPMPPNGLQSMGMQTGYNQHMMIPHDMEQPTHVVGSQGRRGILPSAPGRPAVSSNAVKNTVPVKDADGKFPCPHCNKTYLHAKHLKRHLLRHTGDRPYMCVLCRDTFSRSDILKRHFQKCSIRRGNPTGASHLSHAQAHLKKPQKATQSLPNDLMAMGGMNHAMNAGMSNISSQSGMPFGVDPNGNIPDAGSNMTSDQADRMQRSGMNGAGDGRDRRNLVGPGPGSSNQDGFGQGYNAQIASTMASGMNPPLAFSLPNGQNGHSYNQGYDYSSQGNGDGSIPPPPTWAQVYQSSSHNGLVNRHPSITNNSHHRIKSESTSSTSNDLFTSLYPGISSGAHLPPNSSKWPQNTALEDVSNKLRLFCFPNNTIISARDNALRPFLSPEYIGPFLLQFKNFQVHFPFIHFPTFDRNDTYEGLLLSMICLGAIYSPDLIDQVQVRELMEFSKSVIEPRSRVFAIASQERNGNPFPTQLLGPTKLDLEELTTLYLLCILFTWNGTPVQREKARQQFPLVVQAARRLGLTSPSTGSAFSILHQPNLNTETFEVANFEWQSWVEQEKRSRLLYAIFLADTAMVIYFNSPPLFELFEISLPLPADDASWEASNAQDCAEALGLHGPAASQAKNPEGSRRIKQPEMHSALKALLHHVYDLQPGTTNVFSKFILIHALHTQLWTVQKQLAQDSSSSNHYTVPFSKPGINASMSQYDWVNRGIDRSGSGVSSANTSGRATPTDGITQSSQLLKTTTHAIEKWKKAWDEDMKQQNPPSVASTRKIGFCRDAVHFYWLAKYFLKYHGVEDWQMVPDQRFTYVMQLLKRVKTWAVSDSAQRGEELGSVSQIDTSYGVTNLTLNMSLLFKPVSKHHTPGDLHTIIDNRQYVKAET